MLYILLSCEGLLILLQRFSRVFKPRKIYNFTESEDMFHFVFCR